MKLPDFRKAIELNQLRKKMNADLINVDSIYWKSFDEKDLLTRLKSTEGIILNDSSEVSFEKDKTLNYKGERVLLYIRDQLYNPNYYSSWKDVIYKFHICDCKKIQEFKEGKNLNRYVVSNSIDGIFLINIFDTKTKRMIKKYYKKELKVCKYCLKELNYKGYEIKSKEEQNYIYQNFSLKEFFENYGVKKMFEELPQNNSNIILFN